MNGFHFADPVSQTLLIPLWARAVEQREAEPLVVDPVAASMVEQIDFDWRSIRLTRGDLAQCVVRLREFDRLVRDFLRRRPEAVVVHIGCGLDARFQRVDDGRVRWFDLDLPDVIALRRQFLPETERNRYLAVSVFDADWMTLLAGSGRPGVPTGRSVLFVAEAVLCYFDPDEVKALVIELRRCFPGSELVTDVFTPLTIRFDNLHLLLTGATARLRWGVRDPRELESWADGIRLEESFSYFDDPEPRTGLPSWLGRLGFMRRAATIQRYRLGEPRPSESGGSGSES